MLENKPGHSVVALFIVLLAHGLAIYSLAKLSSVQTSTVSAPVMQGVLIAAPMPTEAKIPEPAVQKKVEPKKKTKKQPEPPKKKPLPVVPENPQAITTEEVPVEEVTDTTETATTETAAAPAAADTVSEEPVIVPPRVDAENLKNPIPPYPGLSRRLNEQGIVVLEILILPTGRVGEIRIKDSSGYKRLDNAALQAVKNWRYIPAKRGNEAISYWYLQPVEFALN